MIAVNTSEEEANSWADDKAKLAKMPPQNPQGSWTRTLRRWYVAIFMGFFSAALAAYWGLNLWVFYQTLDNYNPKRTVDSGFIGSNPGLGYRPMRLKTDPYSSL